MSIPRLSVGLPVYNGEDFVAAAIKSILNQNFQDFELIISDNASQDRTSVICREFAEKDNRIRYYRSEVNYGGARNLNRVFELARGELFKWAAHDDVCLPGFFEGCVEVFDRVQPTVVLVYPQTQFIDEAGRPINLLAECIESKQRRPHQRLSNVLRQLSNLCAQYGVIRSDALQKTRLFDKIIAADFVLLAELAMLGEILEVPEILFQRRMHPGMSSKANVGWRELLKWSDPSNKPYTVPLSPKMRLGYEFTRSIERLPLKPSDRWLCHLSALSVWYSRELRNLVGRNRRRLVEAFRLKVQK